MTDMVAGLDDLEQLFAAMVEHGGRRIAKSALRAAVVEIAREMKRDIPANVADARDSIRHYVAGGNNNIRAKVGVNVGIGRKRQPVKKLPRRRSGGVGISARNADWWIKGTEQRYRGRKRRSDVPRLGQSLISTGRMPAGRDGLASLAFTRAASRLPALMQARAQGQFNKQMKRRA